MASKSYYRVTGESRWQSSSGNAILALTNKPGSGKKLAITSVEVFPQMRHDSGVGTPAQYCNFAIKRTASSGITTGDIVPISSFDSQADSLSSVAEVRTRTNDNGTLTQLKANKRFYRSFTQSAILTGFINNNIFGLPKNKSGSLLSDGLYKNTAVQKIALNAGESLVVAPFMTLGARYSMPYKIEVTFSVNFSPEHTYFATFITNYLEDNSNILAVINKAGSGKIVYIKDIIVSEIGTTDTPYFQVVPIGSVNPLSKYDSLKTLNYTKYDSNYPTLSGIVEAYQDVPILPYGVPEYYAANSATAVVPRNFNYLSTKDFIGPVYQTFFPELKTKSFAAPDDIGLTLSQHHATIKGAGAPIIIREGEGIGIVSAAETATAATAVGLSAWLCFNYSINFSMENAFTPKLVLTGLVNGSEVEILSAGTTTVLAGIEDAVNNAFSWDYEYSAGAKVDIIVHNVLYNYYRLNNISLTAEGLSIPVQQIADRNYKA